MGAKKNSKKEETDLFFSFDFDADVKADSSRDGRLVCALLQVVPHVHFARKSPHLDDGLAEKVVRLAGKLLPHFRLEVVIFVPHAHFDPIRRVVTFTLLEISCIESIQRSKGKKKTKKTKKQKKK